MVYVYPAEGKLKWEKIGWASEGYTAAYASQVRADRLRGLRGHQKAVQTNYTFAQAWEIAWERRISRQASAGNTLSLYRRHLEPLLGGLRLAAITSAHIER
ncbi:MAG: hypothetical protein LBV21_07245, partial [Candidatus Adiutrix sp.]|nr:hypothetical protein [Candidatus Adiutrix sp.]